MISTHLWFTIHKSYNSYIRLSMALFKWHKTSLQCTYQLDLTLSCLYPSCFIANPSVIMMAYAYYNCCTACLFSLTFSYYNTRIILAKDSIMHDMLIHTSHDFITIALAITLWNSTEMSFRHSSDMLAYVSVACLLFATVVPYQQSLHVHYMGYMIGMYITTNLVSNNKHLNSTTPAGQLLVSRSQTTLFKWSGYARPLF